MTAEPTRVDLDSTDGLRLAVYRWDPEGAPRAIAQITHGVGEHARRYQPVVEALLAEGYVVWAHDHRGHGATVTEDRDSAAADFGVIGADGWGLLVADIGLVGQAAKDAHPGLPLALVAHSLGSFATQQLLLDRSDDVTVVVLSGTAAIDPLEQVMDLEADMDLSGFNAPFEPARTEFDWLSRDEAQVDAYIADPWCGFGLDKEATKAMFVGARRLTDPAEVARMRDDLPVYVVVGELDPVNGQMALVTELVRRYEAAGLSDVTLVAYPGARHEVFNETNRAEILTGLTAWLDERLPS